MSYETYYARYEQLKTVYSIAHSTYNTDIEQYDVVVERCGSTYAGSKYRVVRNVPGLSLKDLAIICDRGNLCFGYRVEGSTIVVYTD